MRIIIDMLIALILGTLMTIVILIGEIKLDSLNNKINIKKEVQSIDKKSDCQEVCHNPSNQECVPNCIKHFND